MTPADRIRRDLRNLFGPNSVQERELDEALEDTVPHDVTPTDRVAPRTDHVVEKIVRHHKPSWDIYASQERCACGSLVDDDDDAWANHVREAVWQQEREQRPTREALIEAVIWMTGSADFSPGGIAHEGFEKVVRPVLRELGEAHRGD